MRRRQHAERQRPRREREQQARLSAVRFATEHARSCRQAARWLQLSPRTLAHWRGARCGPTVLPRGRPCREPSPEERLTVESILEETGPRLGLPALQACCPETPRCVLGYLQAGYRRRYQADHRQVVETLHWSRGGTVWAMDHSEPPRPIDGQYTRIFAVRDLASGCQLAWTPVLDATADEALPILERLIHEHGPPLVMKSDNGSAFTGSRCAAAIAHWQIVPLFSPVRMPRYNGACEAGIGAAKRRTEYLAARQGRYLTWSASDLAAAQEWANEAHYPDGFAAGTAASRFAARELISPTERDTLQALIVQYEREFDLAACTAGQHLTDRMIAIHHRRAVRRALVELGYLDITRRSIPQPLHNAKCAKIT